MCTKSMSNLNFFTKLAVDELCDTLFFATGERPRKVYADSSVNLTVNGFETAIINARKILINGKKFKTTTDAKIYIQECI